MKKLKQFFKDWWKATQEGMKQEESYFHSDKPEKDVSSSCPFCGYLGSADEVRCHLLNYHKQ
jgi:hypothetical protein